MLSYVHRMPQGQNPWPGDNSVSDSHALGGILLLADTLEHAFPYDNNRDNGDLMNVALELSPSFTLRRNVTP